MKPKQVIALRAAAALAAALALGACQGGDDSQTALEAANLKKAVYCMELLEKHHDLETAERECFGETYIQHTPWLPDGKDAVLELFAKRVKENPDKTIEIKRAAADGDLVWIHLHSKNAADDPLGHAVVNIFRMEDGKFAEHWNVVQAVPEESANDNTMF
ncbi:nuclear transport factor 2 family protein [Hyphococcus luteus]|nr:nuclear transport factor 2 family protein [Marinicaulis flavus]